MNKAQKIIFYPVLIFTIVSMEYCFYKLIINPDYTTRCGIVVDKKQPATMDMHKHSANISIDEFLYVKYSGAVIKESVDANTFYRFNTGDRICFTSKVENGWHILLGGTGLIANAFGTMIGIVVLWLMIGGKTFKQIWE